MSEEDPVTSTESVESGNNRKVVMVFKLNFIDAGNPTEGIAKDADYLTSGAGARELFLKLIAQLLETIGFRPVGSLGAASTSSTLAEGN